MAKHSESSSCDSRLPRFLTSSFVELFICYPVDIWVPTDVNDSAKELSLLSPKGVRIKQVSLYNMRNLTVGVVLQKKSIVVYNFYSFLKRTQLIKHVKC